jgi:hypothetical protein
MICTIDQEAQTLYFIFLTSAYGVSMSLLIQCMKQLIVPLFNKYD